MWGKKCGGKCGGVRGGADKNVLGCGGVGNVGRSVGRCVGVWGRCSLEKCEEVYGCGGKCGERCGK